MNSMMLGAAAVVLLLMKARGESSSGTPKLQVVPGGKAPKPPTKPAAAAKPKPKVSTPHALVLSPAALPADTRSMAQRAEAQPVPSDQDDMPSGSGPLVDMDGKRTLASPTDPAIVDFDQTSAKPLAPPKKPKPPKKRGGKPPSAAKLSKPAKRTGKQAASDLKDYLDNGGQPGSRANRSSFVRSAQQDMGVSADGVYGPKTRARARSLGVDIQH